VSTDEIPGATDPRPASSTDAARRFRWLIEVRERLPATTWGPALSELGFDVFDAMLSPVNLRLWRHDDDAAPGARASGTSLWRSPWAAIGARWRVARHAARARALAAKVVRADFVFAPVEPTHLQQMLPVAVALRELGASCIFITNRPRLIEALSAAGERPVFSPGSWPGEVSAARARAAAAARTFLALPEPALPQLEDVPADRLVAILRSTISQHLAMVYESEAVFRRIAGEISPRAIVVGNDLTIEGRVFALCGRRAGIASAAIAHGTASGHPFDSCHVVDQFLLFGEQSRRDLIGAGAAPEQLVVCGAPYLDRLPERAKSPHPSVIRELGIDPARPLVLVATSGPGHGTSRAHFDRIIAALMHESLARPETQFVAKLHRKDREANYERARSQVPGSRLHVVPNGAPGLPGTMFEWLGGCSAMVTTASTAAIEAMLVGVPVVTVDLDGEATGVDFIEAGATLHVRTTGELSGALDAALDAGIQGPDLRDRVTRYLADAFLALDGQSARRCAEAILGAVRR
jgi:hypothetical protein